ncbi:hypothetical protein FXO37_23969 [Capsicum annuum]|nr:hypothetical protein FXO37_23969 [Capsicum annuum]
MVELKNLQSNTLTLVLVNIAGIMEKADETLLPGVYKEVGEDLHTDPTGLGSLTLFRSLVQCLCYPLAAYLSARYNRARVIALGAFLWSAATFCVAVSANFTESSCYCTWCFLLSAATFLVAVSANAEVSAVVSVEIELR